MWDWIIHNAGGARLTSAEYLDLLAKMPEFKGTEVRLEKVSKL